MAKTIVEKGQPVITTVPESGRLNIALPTVSVAVRRGGEIVGREKSVSRSIECKI